MLGIGKKEGTTDTDLLTAEDVAERMGVSVYTVWRWIKAGQLRAFKPGKQYRIRPSDLEEFLEAREVRPKAPSRSPLEASFDDVLAEEERRDAPTVNEVQEGYLPFRRGLEDYCARWERLLSYQRLALADIREFFDTAVDLKVYFLAARSHELIYLGEALMRAGEPFSREKLQELSVLRPAYQRYHDLMQALVTRLPEEERRELPPRLRDMQEEMIA